MKNKLVIGQKVYLIALSDVYGKKGEIIESEIRTIGKKYYSVSGLYNIERMKFSIESNRDISNYVSNFQVYFDKQEIEDEKEYNILLGDLRKIVGQYGKSDLTLAQLRSISKIIDANNVQSS